MLIRKRDHHTRTFLPVDRTVTNDATSRKRTKEDIEKRAHEDPDLKALDVKVIDNAMAVLKAKSSHCWTESYKKKA